MRAVLTRVMARDRRGHRRPAHAMPSPARMKRTGIRNPRNSAHQVRQRVTRMIHAPRLPELGVALLAARASVRQWGGRAVKTWALGFVLITCLVSAGGVTASLSPHPTDRPPAGGTNLMPRAPIETRAGGSSDSRFNAGKQPPSGAASQAGATPPLGDVHSGTSQRPGRDPALDIQGLPPAPDDPDLEAALSDLDKQADLDQSMRQQHGLDQHPDAPPPAASTTAPAP